MKTKTLSFRSRGYSLWRTIETLKAQNMIEEIDKNGKISLQLTHRGEHRLVMLGETQSLKGKRWDGKWRVVIFDIPERRRVVRDEVRRFLNTAGFHRLQDSVWVYPHDCEEFISILKVHFKIGRDLLFIMADNIENEFRLERHFNIGSSK